MKRPAIILTIIFILAFPVFSSAASYGSYLNRTVTEEEAAEILKVSVGLEKFTVQENFFSDYNSDGFINSADARGFLRIAQGREKFPPKFAITSRTEHMPGRTDVIRYENLKEVSAERITPGGKVISYYKYNSDGVLARVEINGQSVKCTAVKHPDGTVMSTFYNPFTNETTVNYYDSSYNLSRRDIFTGSEFECSLYFDAFGRISRLLTRTESADYFYVGSSNRKSRVLYSSGIYEEYTYKENGRTDTVTGFNNDSTPVWYYHMVKTADGAEMSAGHSPEGIISKDNMMRMEYEKNNNIISEETYIYDKGREKYICSSYFQYTWRAY